MSKEFKYDKAQHDKCIRKHRYEDMQAAIFFARARGLRAYPCPYCKGAHLTSKDVAKFKRKHKTDVGA